MQWNFPPPIFFLRPITVSAFQVQRAAVKKVMILLTDLATRLDDFSWPTSWLHSPSPLPSPSHFSSHSHAARPFIMKVKIRISHSFLSSPLVFANIFIRLYMANFKCLALSPPSPSLFLSISLFRVGKTSCCNLLANSSRPLLAASSAATSALVTLTSWTTTD